MSRPEDVIRRAIMTWVVAGDPSVQYEALDALDVLLSERDRAESRAVAMEGRANSLADDCSLLESECERLAAQRDRYREALEAEKERTENVADVTRRALSWIQGDTKIRLAQQLEAALAAAAVSEPAPPPEKMCQCGHPASAHRVNYRGPKNPDGRRSVQDSCIATVTRRNDSGDDSWPCPCVDLRPAAAVQGEGTE
jgi:hypothetical protein